MAVRINLGMINDENWDEINRLFQTEYKQWGLFHLWMKKHYDAVEIKKNSETGEVFEFRVFEFVNEGKYAEFCLKWL